MAVHAVAGAGVAYLNVAVQGWMRVWLFGVRPYVLINNLALQGLIYWALVAATYAIDHYGRSQARASEAEARLGQAQLQLLRAQLQPHFLFNALNAIAELMHEDAERADRMIGQLSELLRATLDAGDRQEVRLGEELDVIRHYLAIQETRFGDRFVATVDVPAACLDSPVPHLFLQPLVENAIQHGLAPTAGGGAIHIGATARDGHLLVTVEDDGAGVKPEGMEEGIGLSNTRARLASLYGHGASLTIAPRTGGGTRVTVALPKGGASRRTGA
jgi:two-component system, LytTR family, sensor kinase